MTRLGFQHDLELEGVLSSVTRKLSLQLKEQWLRHLRDHRILAANLIFFKDGLKSTAFMHEDLLAQPNCKLQNREKPKQELLHPTLIIPQKQNIQNIRSKMDSTPFGVARNSNQ